MNYIVNDYGQTVIAEGAPGSIIRSKAQYPKLIDRINSIYWQSEGKETFEAILPNKGRRNKELDGNREYSF